MSKRNQTEFYEDIDEDVEVEDYGEYFFDDTDESVYSDDESQIIQDQLEAKKLEEQQMKDRAQLIGLQSLQIKKKHSWTVPMVELDQQKNKEFPLLLEKDTGYEVKPKKSFGGFIVTNNIDVYYGGKNDFVLKDVVCKFFQAGKCTKHDCRFLHTEIVRKPCRYGAGCTNQKCGFVHETVEVKQEIIKKNHKHLLCLHIFKIVNGKLVENKTSSCRFGENCVYAHSVDEVKNAITQDGNKKCKYAKGCMHVSSTIVQKVVKDKPLEIYKYQNATEFCKCNRVHYKESIVNFIVRVQGSRRAPPTPQQNKNA